MLLWDVTDSARPRRLGDPLAERMIPGFAVAFAADGHTLATASQDGTVLLWDVTDPTRPHRLGDPRPGGRRRRRARGRGARPAESDWRRARREGRARARPGDAVQHGLGGAGAARSRPHARGDGTPRERAARAPRDRERCGDGGMEPRHDLARNRKALGEPVSQPAQRPEAALLSRDLPGRGYQRLRGARHGGSLPAGRGALGEAGGSGARGADAGVRARAGRVHAEGVRRGREAETARRRLPRRARP